MAPRRRPGDAPGRHSDAPASGRASPLPGHGPAAARRRGELPPPDDAAGIRRNDMAVGANHPRTIARPQYGPASARRRTNGPSENPRRRGCRLPRHDGGRPERHHARTARGLLAQRTVAPAGRIGTAHGHRLRAGQSAVVVAAAAAQGPSAAQPAGGGLHLDLRRRSGISAQRREGGGDVHDAPVGPRLRVGIQRPERPRRGRLRHAVVESRMARRHQLPTLVRGCRGNPSMGRTPLPPAPHPAAGAEPDYRRAGGQPCGDAGHGAPRIAYVRHRAAGGSRRQSGSDPARKRRGAAAEYALGGGATAAVYLFFALATVAAWSAEPKKSVHLPA